jgi:crossover junction endodeoxyribonuclease RuvC
MNGEQGTDVDIRPFILGIDPGAQGAIALLTPSGEMVRITDMPTVSVKRGTRQVNEVSAPALTALVRWAVGICNPSVSAVVEKVHSMPGQGVASMFAFGRAVGVIEGVLAGLGIPMSMVTPQEWRRVCRVRQGKDGSRARAMELWPNEAHVFSRVKDDGRAEAALIGRSALYGGRSGCLPAPAFSSARICAPRTSSEGAKS